MTVLRLLSLVAIAGICIGVFTGVYLKFQGLSAAKRAGKVASDLSSDIQDVIIKGDSHTTEVKIPSEYTLHFGNYEAGWQLAIDGTRLPEGGFDLPVKFENRSELSAGTHELHIKLGNNWVIVSKVD